MTAGSPKANEMDCGTYDQRRTEQVLAAGIACVLFFTLVALGYVLLEILASF